jgi:membrane-bound serine protease (ClpP class)
VSAGFFIFAVTKAIRARLTKPTTGMEGLIGEIGTASTPIAPEGKISIHGEFWNVTSEQKIEAGEKVQVIGVVNLKMKVKRIE